MPSQAPSSLAALLGQNIRAARLEKGWTQRQLAERFGGDPMLVSKWERGWHRPSEANLTSLAQVFDCDIAWFYTHAPEQAA